jgi:hypothetical protein
MRVSKKIRNRSDQPIDQKAIEEKGIDINHFLADDVNECDYCLELVIKIRQGKITGAVLSCHPLDKVADIQLAQYIESKKISA